MKTPKLPPTDQNPDDLCRQLRRMTRRGFAWGGAAVFAGFAARRWINVSGDDGMIRRPLRRILQLDEKISRLAFDPRRLSKPFPPSLARMPRVNGRYGIDTNIDLAGWKLDVQGLAGGKSYTIADIKALPRFEVTTELRCIEGWSEVVTWAGARLADLAFASGLARRSGRPGELDADPGDLLHYVELKTPNALYYVGLDMPSALHPQTLLCYEMNGQPLTILHGAPLRLAIPVKYGIKNLKQVGTIRFTDIRPADYWESKGYDWYAGL